MFKNEVLNSENIKKLMIVIWRINLIVLKLREFRNLPFPIFVRFGNLCCNKNYKVLLFGC